MTMTGNSENQVGCAGCFEELYGAEARDCEFSGNIRQRLGTNFLDHGPPKVATSAP